MKLLVRNTIEDDLRKLRSHFTAYNETAVRILRQLDLQADEGGYCKQPKIHIIQEVVAANYQLPITVMTTPIRTRAFANARSVAIYLCRETTRFSHAEIGKCFNRHHGTILWAHERIVERMRDEPSLANEVLGLKGSIEGRFFVFDREKKAQLQPQEMSA